MRIDSRLSERLLKVKPSSTLAITSKAKKLKGEGRDVVTFAAGEPDFDTPDAIKEEAILAIRSGFTKYTPTTGIPELKKLICEKFKKDNSLDYQPNQIVVSCGAKHSIFNTLFVLIDHGDEVLIPSPYWVSYPEMVNLCEGAPRFINSRPENNFKINIEDLEKHIGSKTKVFILNSPSNPTGCVYDKDELKEIARICVERKIFVISDEIYEKIIFDNLKHISIGSLGKDIYDYTITVNGLSKSYSMTGWRIGYLAGPVDIVEAVSKFQDHSTSNPTSISQKAALAALSLTDDFSRTMCLEFSKKRDYIISRLNKIKKIGYCKPSGAFYIFCDISKTGLDSVQFSSRLLDEMMVAVIPGDPFGRNDYIRLSFATSLNEIEKGMDRIEGWVNKL
ncbi:MAG: pyridoxal phosphate-dependent aminotransferase [Candidatus Omnitrophota bacterium]|nr:pyridoxal phosphate-dependent aminotransferase [Candidatus Omnitrophota bacterium]MBU1928767.1 pyridoxal phosphate-dependent aminotransferase [Candidatus Omnitrophota bacterium]MBU2034222.1 pyridoxal phosphate-dependent aminotransferase [Candidatus Omnitrophota bacterium]MBU2221838.1 pyridoxal phosphate-dependent aminotransferase [Candidatus Omnitrophota bacterium]MBU2258350.1 pyridoxal phosphate-dependent aminotransferase [Candidatus Omnitrophota bacterium]